MVLLDRRQKRLDFSFDRVEALLEKEPAVKNDRTPVRDTRRLYAVDGLPAARHELRITLKKLRYVSEFFQSLYGAKDARRYLNRLSRLQDVLGTLNDVATAGRVLEELLGRVGPPDADSLARTVGFIEGFAAREDAHSLRKLESQWKRFDRTRPFWARD